MAASSHGLRHNLAVAIGLIEQGIPVFPCAASGPNFKAPLTPHGFLDATIDPAQVRAWWLKHPDALVGFPTSSNTTVVLDVDGQQGHVSLAALCRRRGIEDECSLTPVRNRTPSPDSQHFYFRLREGEVFRNRASDIAPGLDTRGVTTTGSPAGYVIAPGSRLTDGRRYEPAGESRNLADAAFVPRWLLYFTTFNAPQRTRIMRTPQLRTAICESYPCDWTAIFSEHTAREHEAMLNRAKPAGDEAIHLQAAHDLREAARELAALTDGRRNALFLIGCRVAKYVSHGVVVETQFRAVLTSAATANGSIAKHGQAWAAGVLTRALMAGRNDPLPPIANQFRKRGLAA